MPYASDQNKEGQLTGGQNGRRQSEDKMLMQCLNFRVGSTCQICETHGEPVKKAYLSIDEMLTHMIQSHELHFKLLFLRVEELSRDFKAKDLQPESEKLNDIQRLAEKVESVEYKIEAQARRRDEEIEESEKSIQQALANAHRKLKRIEGKSDTLVANNIEAQKIEEDTALLIAQVESYETLIVETGLDQPEETPNLTVSVKSLQQTDMAMNEKIEKTKSVTYNGKGIFTINGYKNKKLAAQQGDIISLDSPLFYTSKNGYKMCCRVFLNGDELSCNKHLSLCLITMTGDYDDLLQWPLKAKVLFKLIDRKDHSKDIIKTIMVEIIRPPQGLQTEEKIGISAFAPIHVVEDPLQGYLIDDSIIIEVTVECESCRGTQVPFQRQDQQDEGFAQALVQPSAQSHEAEDLTDNQMPGDLPDSD